MWVLRTRNERGKNSARFWLIAFRKDNLHMPQSHVREIQLSSKDRGSNTLSTKRDLTEPSTVSISAIAAALDHD